MGCASVTGRGHTHLDGLEQLGHPKSQPWPLWFFGLSGHWLTRVKTGGGPGLTVPQLQRWPAAASGFVWLVTFIQTPFPLGPALWGSLGFRAFLGLGVAHLHT